MVLDRTSSTMATVMEAQEMAVGRPNIRRLADSLMEDSKILLHQSKIIGLLNSLVVLALGHTVLVELALGHLFLVELSLGHLFLVELALGHMVLVELILGHVVLAVMDSIADIKTLRVRSGILFKILRTNQQD
jgi:hypothetical protein